MNNYIKALSISERYEIINTFNDKILLGNPAISRFKFRKLPNILTDKQFNQMIQKLDVNQSSFDSALELEIPVILNEAYSKAITGMEWYKTYISMYDLELGSINIKEKGLNTYLAIFTEYAKRKLKFVLNQKHNFVINNVDKLLEELIGQIEGDLSNIAYKTLILELNIARSNEILKGNSAEDRFWEFTEKGLDKKNLKGLYAKYPVLARILTETTINKLKAIKLFFERLSTDYVEIKKKFFNNIEVSLDSVSVGSGDTHQNGKSVYQVKFDNKHKIVYKPRNLKIVSFYNNVLSKLNQFENILELKNYNGIYKDDYAYEEFVTSVSMTNINQFSRYYQRFGQLLGLMYIISGRDLHMENIIASGEYPIVTDLETILQKDSKAASNYKTASEKAQSFVHISSLVSGMLPTKMTHLNVDMSALSGGLVDATVPSQTISNVGTDTMKLVSGHVEIEKSNNLPMMSDKTISYQNFIDEIILGFENVYNVFMENNFDLKVNQIDKFPVRTIIRNTQSYASMMEASYYPTYLQNSVIRESIFMNVFNNEFPDDLSKYEYRDMMNNDIPIFFNLVGNHYIYGSDMSIVSKNYLNNESLGLKHGDKLNNENRELEKSLILSRLVKTHSAVVKSNRNQFYDKKVETNDQNILDAAKLIGDTLIYKGVEYNNGLGLLTLDYDSEDLNVKEMGSSLYSGKIGTALFMYYLAAISKEIKYKNAFLKLMNEIENSRDLQSLGVFEGITGKLYLYYRLYKDTGDVKYKEKIESVFQIVQQYLSSDSHTELKNDWLGGSSSISLVLINLFRYTNNLEYLEAAIDLGERIFKNINETTDSGFAHGYSSLALLFTNIFDITKSNRYRVISEELISKENEQFNSKYGWFDSYQDEKNNSYPQNWCHGSVGIGISRIEIQRLLGNDYSENIMSVQEFSGIQANDSLCHGNSGLAELYLMLGNKSKANKIMSQLISNNNFISNLNIAKVNESRMQDLGLFTGLTGIGFELLRIFDQSFVPNILVLE